MSYTLYYKYSKNTQEIGILNTNWQRNQICNKKFYINSITFELNAWQRTYKLYVKAIKMDEILNG